MNLPSAYIENTHHLAVGFDPIDVMSGTRPSSPVRLDLEMPDNTVREIRPGYRRYQKRSDRVPYISRHDSGLYKLLYLNSRQLPDNAIVRVHDDQREFIPRRFRFAIPAAQDTWLEQKPRSSRRQRPMLFPANAYPVAERAMGLRGRVMRDDEPMPWAWIGAFYLIRAGDDANPVFLRRGRIGRAISDQHGEFLLILNPLPQQGAGVPDLESNIWVNVVISGPAAKPQPPDGNTDPYWSVPVEQLPNGGMADPAADPDYLPPGYASSNAPDGNRNIAFPPGRMLTGVDIPDFIFSLP